MYRRFSTVHVKSTILILSGSIRHSMQHNMSLKTGAKTFQMFKTACQCSQWLCSRYVWLWGSLQGLLWSAVNTFCFFVIYLLGRFTPSIDVSRVTHTFGLAFARQISICKSPESTCNCISWAGSHSSIFLIPICKTLLQIQKPQTKQHLLTILNISCFLHSRWIKLLWKYLRTGTFRRDDVKLEQHFVYAVLNFLSFCWLIDYTEHPMRVICLSHWWSDTLQMLSMCMACHKKKDDSSKGPIDLPCLQEQEAAADRPFLTSDGVQQTLQLLFLRLHSFLLMHKTDKGMAIYNMNIQTVMCYCWSGILKYDTYLLFNVLIWHSWYMDSWQIG